MPLQLVAYDADWPIRFQDASAELIGILGPEALVDHIGSTSIPACSAQPIVDVLVQVPAIPLSVHHQDALEAIGYGEQLGAAGVNQMFFRQLPLTKVHLTAVGSNYAADRLGFRDYLRGHEQRRAQYEDLKGLLSAEHPNDPIAYTAGKHAFVQETIALAAAGLASS
jgi:GrpB-like predicted nucleotidyltransferase (UPF0157 family)